MSKVELINAPFSLVFYWEICTIFFYIVILCFENNANPKMDASTEK